MSSRAVCPIRPRLFRIGMHAATPSNKADGTPYTPALLPRAGLFLPGLPAMFGTLPYMSFGQWSIYHTPPIFLLHNNSVLCNFQYKFSHFFVNFFLPMFLTVKNGLIFKGLIKLIVQNKTAQHLGYVLAPKLLYSSRSKSRVKLKSADGKPTQLLNRLSS